MEAACSHDRPEWKCGTPGFVIVYLMIKCLFNIFGCMNLWPVWTFVYASIARTAPVEPLPGLILRESTSDWLYRCWHRLVELREDKYRKDNKHRFCCSLNVLIQSLPSPSAMSNLPYRQHNKPSLVLLNLCYKRGYVHYLLLFWCTRRWRYIYPALQWKKAKRAD